MKKEISKYESMRRHKVSRYISTLYLFVETKVIVPDELHENYPGKNIYRKDSKFSDRSSEQRVQTEISLLPRNRSD